MKNLLLILALLILNSCIGSRHYRTENYKIGYGVSPAKAYQKHWNSHLIKGR